MPRGPAVRSDERKMLTGARRGRLSRAGISGRLTLPDPAVLQAEMFIPSGLPPSRLLASHPVLFGSDGCPSLAPGDMQNPPRPFFPGRGGTWLPKWMPRDPGRGPGATVTAVQAALLSRFHGFVFSTRFGGGSGSVVSHVIVVFANRRHKSSQVLGFPSISLIGKRKKKTKGSRFSNRGAAGQVPGIAHFRGVSPLFGHGHQLRGAVSRAACPLPHERGPRHPDIESDVRPLPRGRREPSLTVLPVSTRRREAAPSVIAFGCPENRVRNNKHTSPNLKDARNTLCSRGCRRDRGGHPCPACASAETGLPGRSHTSQRQTRRKLLAFAFELATPSVSHLHYNLLFISHAYNLLPVKESI